MTNIFIYNLIGLVLCRLFISILLRGNVGSGVSLVFLIDVDLYFIFHILVLGEDRDGGKVVDVLVVVGEEGVALFLLGLLGGLGSSLRLSLRLELLAELQLLLLEVVLALLRLLDVEAVDENHDEDEQDDEHDGAVDGDHGEGRQVLLHADSLELVAVEGVLAVAARRALLVQATTSDASGTTAVDVGLVVGVLLIVAVEGIRGTRGEGEHLRGVDGGDVHSSLLKGGEPGFGAVVLLLDLLDLVLGDHDVGDHHEGELVAALVEGGGVDDLLSHQVPVVDAGVGDGVAEDVGLGESEVVVLLLLVEALGLELEVASGLECLGHEDHGVALGRLAEDQLEEGAVVASVELGVGAGTEGASVGVLAAGTVAAAVQGAVVKHEVAGAAELAGGAVGEVVALAGLAVGAGAEAVADEAVDLGAVAIGGGGDDLGGGDGVLHGDVVVVHVDLVALLGVAVDGVLGGGVQAAEDDVVVGVGLDDDLEGGLTQVLDARDAVGDLAVDGGGLGEHDLDGEGGGGDRLSVEEGGEATSGIDLGEGGGLGVLVVGEVPHDVLLEVDGEDAGTAGVEIELEGGVGGAEAVGGGLHVVELDVLEVEVIADEGGALQGAVEGEGDDHGQGVQGVDVAVVAGEEGDGAGAVDGRGDGDGLGLGVEVVGLVVVEVDEGDAVDVVVGVGHAAGDADGGASVLGDDVVLVGVADDGLLGGRDGVVAGRDLGEAADAGEVGGGHGDGEGVGLGGKGGELDGGDGGRHELGGGVLLGGGHGVAGEAGGVAVDAVGVVELQIGEEEGLGAALIALEELALAVVVDGVGEGRGGGGGEGEAGDSVAVAAGHLDGGLVLGA